MRRDEHVTADCTSSEPSRRCAVVTLTDVSHTTVTDYLFVSSDVTSMITLGFTEVIQHSG